MDSTTQVSNGVSIEDAVGTADTQSLTHNRALYVARDTGVVVFDGTLTSFDANGYTLNVTTTDGTARQWFEVGIESSAAPSVPVSQVSETDVSQSIALAEVDTVGQISESDQAQQLGLLEQVAIAQPTETDLARVIGFLETFTLGQPTETDNANPIVHGIVEALAQSTETDLARVIGRLETFTLGQPADVESARTITPLEAGEFPVGQSQETDLAQAIQSAFTIALGLNAETDTSQSIGLQETEALGQSQEVSSAQPIPVGEQFLIGRALDQEQAQPLVVLQAGPQTLPVRTVLELDFPYPLTVIGGVPPVALPTGGMWRPPQPQRQTRRVSEREREFLRREGLPEHVKQRLFAPSPVEKEMPEGAEPDEGTEVSTPDIALDLPQVFDKIGSVNLPAGVDNATTQPPVPPRLIPGAGPPSQKELEELFLVFLLTEDL